MCDEIVFLRPLGLRLQNVDLYNANKREVRKDISAFQDYVYEQQDAIDAEVEAEKETTDSADGKDKKPA